MKKLAYFLFFFSAFEALCGLYFPLAAQDFDALEGIPYIRNYSPKDYRADFQNWTILQDKRGIMYFGNNEGVLEFDGAFWRLIQMPNKSVVRSMAIDKDGTIYVGAAGELGLLQANAKGQMVYQSLKSKLPAANQNFADVWRVIPTQAGVIFQTFNEIFVLQNGNFHVIKPETTFHVSFTVNQRYFVRQRERGLMTYENGRLRLLPDGELFASERVYAMLPYDENKVLIVSRGKGLYLYDGNGIEKFDSPDEKILVESQVYAGLPLPDGTYALASTQQGLFIVGKNGKILKNYNKESGLQNNSIYNLYLDKQQNLWMALEYGISFLKLNSPFEFFDERLNIEGGINHIELDTDENRLFLCTNKGLFTRNLNIDPKTKQNRFELIENTDGQSWFVRKVNEQWLFGHSEGLFQIKGKKAIRNAEVSSLISISPLGEYPGHLIGGSSAGLHTFESQKGNWSLKANLKGFEGYFEQFSFFQEDEQGFLWTSREDKGVMRLKLNNALDSLIFNKFFESSQHNLPSNLKIRVFNVDKRVVFATEKGIYRFNSKTNVFEKDPLDAYLSEPMRVFFLAEDSQGNIWFSAEKEIGVLLKQGGGKYKAYTKPFFKLLGENILYIRPVNANHAFFGTTNGLVFYNGKSVELLEKNMQNFSVLIRRVEKVSGNDPIVFGGNFVDKQLKLLDEQNAFQVPNLPFEVGYGLRFNFVATDYEENSKIQYQYYLEGFDSQWSAWTSRTDKEYTNLPEGRYTFHVKAKNMYQLQSKEAKYTFVILPPWYRTYWAYGLYIISISLLIWAIINLYTLQLRRNQKNLSEKISQSTQELRIKNLELEKQKNEITSQAQKLTQLNSDLEGQKDEIALQNSKLAQKNIEVEKARIKLEEKNLEVEAQKETLVEIANEMKNKNKQILDSLYYAQNIQTAILPTHDEMSKHFQDYFVINRPKDVVSGDFYWLSHFSANAMQQILREDAVASKTFVAVADCTGHGVAGACMSMLGYALLNEIVNQRHLFDTVRVLEMLNLQIRVELRQKDELNADGMDIALCCIEEIDDTHVKVEFTGAKRSLYYVAKGGHELQELKGDRKSIGGFRRRKVAFTKSEVILEKGSKIYLTTDGYGDQHGPTTIKIGSKRVQMLLEQYAHLSMEAQANALLDYLYQHQKGVQQRDDMLILGITV